MAGATEPRTAGQEWRSHWPLVLSAMIGMTFGTVPSTSLGVLMGPLREDLAFTSTQMAFGMTIFALVSTPLSPFAGGLIDRFGPRNVALPGLVLAGLSFAAFSLMTGAYWQWVLIWIAYSLAAVLIRTTVWSAAVSGVFESGRGLALAVVLCGTALTQSISPPLTHWLESQYGWRGAYAGLGIGWSGLALILVFLFFHTRSARQRAAEPTPAAAEFIPGGLSFRAALRDQAVVRIGLAMFIQATIGSAALVHMVPLLKEAGVSAGQAAGIAALLGVSSIAGKLLMGWLVDRVTSGLLPVAAFAMPALGYFLLLQAEGSALALSCAVSIIGFASGSCLQLTTYLTTRYAGLRNFGKIFGTIAALMGLGSGIGPLIASQVYDRFDSYALFIEIAIPSALLAGVLAMRLGPFPEFARTRAAEAAE